MAGLNEFANWQCDASSTVLQMEIQCATLKHKAAEPKKKKNNSQTKKKIEMVLVFSLFLYFQTQV